MANPKFLGVDLSIQTFLWTGGENTAKPLSNLKTYFPNQVSGSDTLAAGQKFNIDRGSALATNCLIIHNTNFASLGCTSINFQQSDDSAYTTGVTTIQDINAITPIDGIYYVPFSSVTKEYFRLVFAKGSNLSVKPEIGNIFLGTTLDFEKPQQWGFFTNMPFNPKSVDLRSLDNTGRTAVTGKNIRKHLISFDDKNTLTDSFITSYLAFLTTTYNGKVPFYYVDNNSTIYLVKFEKDYNPYETFLKDQNKIQNLAMESVMADS